MNIFKVFASGKRKLNEEYTSAILAWFLNPKMEHGLGYQFISRFVDKITEKDNSDIGKLRERLKTRLRSEHSKEVKFDCFLERSAGKKAVIDIILAIDDWVIAIENKIHPTSVSMDQLQREYDGLLEDRFSGKKIIMVYLIPLANGLMPPHAEKEFHALMTDKEKEHSSALITWQAHEDHKIPSIVGIINEILRDEREARIDPVSEYTLHTLRALAAFIQNDFSGYEFEKEPGEGGRADRLPLHDILNKKSGYVGVLHGIPGLLRLSEKELKRDFAFTEADMSNTRCYIEVAVFKNIVEWLSDGKPRDISWDEVLPFDSVMKIARSFGDKVVIGVKGGTDALSKMNSDGIKSRKYVIESTATKGKLTNDWMTGSVFVDVVKKQLE